jgi:hypothetical protein
VTVFTIALSRAAGVARQLLDPSARQVITRDRFPSYAWLPLTQRPICRAQLQRDFQALVDRDNTGSPISEESLCCVRDPFTW